MPPKTLYDIIQPIRWRLNLFGFNFGKEKPAGCLRKVFKLVVRSMLLYQMWRILITECGKKTYDPTDLMYLNVNILLITGFNMIFFIVDEGEIDALIKRFNAYPLGEWSNKRISKHLIPFKISCKFFIVVFLAVALFTCDIVIRRLTSSSPQTFPSNFFSIFRMVYLVSSLFALQVPTLFCILPSLVACYCRAEVDEAIAEMKRFKSPLRRAKASAKLVEKYRKLYELASDTDRALSNAMYFIKWPFLITMAASVMATRSVSRVYSLLFVQILNIFMSVIYLSSNLAYFVLLQYLHLAPSANQMTKLINKSVLECNSIDDEWLSRDPISRPYLLQKRMQLIDELNQVAMDQPPFTLFGDVVDADVSYMIILDLIDMLNTLTVHNDQSEEMALNRIYRSFLKKCVDCTYWEKII